MDDGTLKPVRDTVLQLSTSIKLAAYLSCKDISYAHGYTCTPLLHNTSVRLREQKKKLTMHCFELMNVRNRLAKM